MERRFAVETWSVLEHSETPGQTLAMDAGDGCLKRLVPSGVAHAPFVDLILIVSCGFVQKHSTKTRV